MPAQRDKRIEISAAPQMLKAWLFLLLAALLAFSAYLMPPGFFVTYFEHALAVPGLNDLTTESVFLIRDARLLLLIPLWLLLAYAVNAPAALRSMRKGSDTARRRKMPGVLAGLLIVRWLAEEIVSLHLYAAVYVPAYREALSRYGGFDVDATVSRITNAAPFMDMALVVLGALTMLFFSLRLIGAGPFVGYPGAFTPAFDMERGWWSFAGKMGRMELFVWLLITRAVAGAMTVFFKVLSPLNETILYAGAIAIGFVMAIMGMVRRLRDLGMRPLWVLTLLIPGYNLYLLVKIFFARGESFRAARAAGTPGEAADGGASGDSPHPEEGEQTAQGDGDPVFLGTSVTDAGIFETYSIKDAEEAKRFLTQKNVTTPQYYVRVQTGDGVWGKDKEGFYLEALLPWKLRPEEADCKGSTTMDTINFFSIRAAASGHADNFVCTVACGGCGEQWLDGLRYEDVTAVRCPHCGAVNAVDSTQFLSI